MGTRAFNKILLFGGTYEGRNLAEFCKENGINADIRVATDYGKEIISHLGDNVFAGRLDEKDICKLLQTASYDAVVDATHPYATLVTENIKNACSANAVEYIRVQRDTQNPLEDEDILFFDSMEEASLYLNDCEGAIFLTTGSKELHKLKGLRNIKERLIVRALPFAYALENCEALGVAAHNIILMQGPFDKALNIALMQKYSAKFLVTKLTGKTGGFDAKILAARELGMKTLVIGRPSNGGISPDAAKSLLLGDS